MTNQKSLNSNYVIVPGYISQQKYLCYLCVSPQSYILDSLIYSQSIYAHIDSTHFSGGSRNLERRVQKYARATLPEMFGVATPIFRQR